MKRQYVITTRDLKGRFAAIRKGSKRIVNIYDTKTLKKVSLLVDASAENFKKQIKSNPKKFFDNKTFKGETIKREKHIPLRYRKKVEVTKEEVTTLKRDSILYDNLKFFDTVVLGINLEALFTFFKKYKKEYTIEYYNFGVVGLDANGVPNFGRFTPNIIDLDNDVFIEQMIKLYEILDINKLTYKVTFQSVLRIVYKKGAKNDKNKRKSKK